MNFKKFIPILSLFILLTLIIGVVSAADASDLEADIDSGIDLSLNNEDFNVDCTAECNDYNTDDNIQNDINLTDNNDLDLSQDSKDTDKELKSSNLASTIVFTEKDYSTYFTKGNLIPSSLNPGDTLDFSGTFTNKNFIINIPLTLTSSSNAQLVDCSIILVTGSDGSVISNLNINTTRLNAPVLNINNVTNVSIINNNIFSSGSGSYGVSLYNVSNSNIFFNDVRTTAFENGRPHPSGILLMGSSYNNISSNNVIVNDSNGIYLSGYGVNLPNSYNYIFNNTVHSVRGVEWELDEDGKTPLPSSFCYAVQIMGSNNQIFNNTVYNAYRGISTESTGNNISGNIVHDIKGTWYSGDTEEDGGDNAIRALGNSIVKHNIVYNCHIKSGGSAVFVGGDSLVYNNSINNIEGNGVYLAQNNINFTNNTLNNISNYGLYVQGAYTNITISNNFINSTDYCIALLKTKKTLYPFDLVIDSNKLYTEKNTAIYYEENCIGNIVITNNEGNVININITRDRVTVSDVTVSPSSVNINDTVVIKPSVTYMGYSVAGTVDIYINGEKETTVDIDSTYEFKPSHAGQFNVSVAFMDEGYYNASVSKAVLLKVLGSTQTTVSLNATNVTVNDSVLVTPSVSSYGQIIEGTVEILVNGVKETSVAIGSAYVFVPAVNGSYDISARFTATDIYGASLSDIVVLTVNPLNGTNGTGNDTNASGLNATVTTIGLNATNVTVNDSVLITPSVSFDGIVIEGTVDILVNGFKVGSVAIGSGYDFIPTVEGIYNISASFEATEVYNSSLSEIIALTVNPLNDTNDTNFIVLSDDNYFDYFDLEGISTVLNPSGNYTIEIDEINNKDIQILSGSNITIRAKEGSGIINNGTIFVSGIDDDVESVIISGLTFNNTDDTAIEIGEYVSDINLTKNNIFVDGGSKSTGAYYSVYGINANGFITSMNIEDNNVTVVGTASYAYAIQLGAYDASSNPRDIIIKNNVIVMNGTAKSGMIEGIYLDCVINALVENNNVDLCSINDVYVYGIQIADSSYLSIGEGNTDIMSPHNILITSNNFTLNSEYMVYGITVLDYGCDSSVNEYGQANRNMLDLNTTICDNIIDAYSNRGLLGIVGNTYNMSVFGNNVTAFAGSSEGVASNDVLGVGTYVLGVQYNAPLSAGYRVSVKDNTLITNITAEYINNHIFDELVDFENNKVLLDLAIAGNIGNLTNDTVNVGQTIEYNFTVSNYGPSKAFDVSVVFEFNDLIEFIESKLDGTDINSSSLNSSAILLNIGDLDTNESMNLILTFRVVSNGTIENAVFVNSSGFDTNESNNELFISVLSVKAPYGSKDLQDLIDSAPEDSVLDLSNYTFYEVSNIIIDKDITITGGRIEAKAGETVFIIVPKSKEGPNEVNIAGINFVVNNANTIVLATADNSSDIDLIDVAAINFAQNNLELANDNVVAESVTVLELDSERSILAPTNNITVRDNTLPSGVNPFRFEVTAFADGTNVVVSEGGNVPEKLETVIILDNMTTFAYQSSVDGDIGDYFYASLQDVNGNPLSNKTVKVGLNGRVYTRTTNATGGIGVLMKTAISGRYTFAVSFLGDDNYNASFAVALCTVNKQTPKLSTSSKTYKASAKTKTISATLKTNAGNPLKGKTIKFTINGKTYSATSDSKGVASVKVSLSKKGSYSFTVKYAGDDTYASVSKKATLKLT